MLILLKKERAVAMQKDRKLDTVYCRFRISEFLRQEMDTSCASVLSISSALLKALHSCLMTSACSVETVETRTIFAVCPSSVSCNFENLQKRLQTKKITSGKGMPVFLGWSLSSLSEREA